MATQLSPVQELSISFYRALEDAYNASTLSDVILKLRNAANIAGEAENDGCGNLLDDDDNAAMAANVLQTLLEILDRDRIEEVKEPGSHVYDLLIADQTLAQKADAIAMLNPDQMAEAMQYILDLPKYQRYPAIIALSDIYIAMGMITQKYFILKNRDAVLDMISGANNGNL